MPEGDTIHRVASQLHLALAGRVLTDARGDDLVTHRSRRRGSTRDAMSLGDAERSVDWKMVTGQRVQQIEAMGKHLLIHVSSGHVIHSHLGMTGAWHIYRPGEAWRKPRHGAALILNACGSSLAVPMADSIQAVCFYPRTLELLTVASYQRHPWLSRLGPDLMQGVPADESYVARFRMHDRVTIGEAIMNQTIVSGIGNVYKSEVLFLTRRNPWTRIAHIDDSGLVVLVTEACRLMHPNRQGSPRRTRYRGDHQRLWVYGRQDERCLICGDRIAMRRQGELGRSTYWCPGCQVAN